MTYESPRVPPEQLKDVDWKGRLHRRGGIREPNGEHLSRLTAKGLTCARRPSAAKALRTRGSPSGLHLFALSFALFILSLYSLSSGASGAKAFSWVPSEEQIQKYRGSWNPLSNGPNFMPLVEVQPKGQFDVHPFMFGQVGEKRFGNTLTTDRMSSPTHLYQNSLVVTSTYGLTNHVSVGMSLTGVSHWTRDSTRSDGPVRTDSGPADTFLGLSYRPVVQDPESWRPSVTTLHLVTLPTGQWFGTSKPAGGFVPLGKLPATRFGALSFTEGLMVRKNLQPFRVSAGVFYTYSAPGNDAGRNTYPGDIVNTRLALEHILDDVKGFGYIIEFVGLHGVPFRADGHPVNIKPGSFNILGIGPTIQYRFSEQWMGAAGVLFTVAGQNALDSFYPNFSLYWYWSKTGKVIMR